jgi:hypothetical protein
MSDLLSSHWRKMMHDLRCTESGMCHFLTCRRLLLFPHHFLEQLWRRITQRVYIVSNVHCVRSNYSFWYSYKWRPTRCNYFLISWFQTFALFWMLYAFFWVIPRRLNFICRRFRTLCLFHLHRQVGMKNNHSVWEWIKYLYRKRLARNFEPKQCTPATTRLLSDSERHSHWRYEHTRSRVNILTEVAT